MLTKLYGGHGPVYLNVSLSNVDAIFMNAAFLVQRDQEQAFDRRIKEIASTFDKLTFKYTGPWPPYNFVNIRLKLERAGQH